MPVLVLIFFVMFLAGFTKGVVGFALPMIAISGIGSLTNADLAILSLLLPSLVTNIWQSFRSGFGSALTILKRFKRIFIVMPVALALAAQIFTLVDDQILFLVLGAIVISFVLMELWGPEIDTKGKSPKIEYGIGVASGISGGLSGVWGPPIMIYFLAHKMPKLMFVQAAGLVFLIGSVVLNLSHLSSGLLNEKTAQLSLAMVLPAVAGMWLGYQVQDRLDQDKFRRATLFVLLVAGFNLLRKGLV